jgi:hypothetical protein
MGKKGVCFNLRRGLAGVQHGACWKVRKREFSKVESLLVSKEVFRM